VPPPHTHTCGYKVSRLESERSAHGSNLMPKRPCLFLPGAINRVLCRVSRGSLSSRNEKIADATRHPPATTFDGRRLVDVHTGFAFD